MRYGEQRPCDTWSQLAEAYYDRPIRIGMTLLTTNDIAELVVFLG